MKKHLRIVFGLAIFGLMLTACQTPPEDLPAANDPQRSLDEAPDQENADIETAYPAEEGQAVQETLDMDAAYPVTEEDLELLHKTWETTVYSEDGIIQEPTVITLRFNADGTYEMTTESGMTAGDWTARLSTLESLLILTDDTGESQTYEIIELEENLLILQSWRETIQIEQQLQPAE